jgi:hypothetical protein
LYITEIALCAGTRCNIQNIKLRKEENGRGREEKPLEVQSCKQKVVKKKSLLKEAFLQVPCKTGSWTVLRESNR